MRIWTGRAGSGKTTAILREIAARCESGGGRQILLVPELNSHRMAVSYTHLHRTCGTQTGGRVGGKGKVCAAAKAKQHAEQDNNEL